VAVAVFVVCCLLLLGGTAVAVDAWDARKRLEAMRAAGALLGLQGAQSGRPAYAEHALAEGAPVLVGRIAGVSISLGLVDRAVSAQGTPSAARQVRIRASLPSPLPFEAFIVRRGFMDPRASTGPLDPVLDRGAVIVVSDLDAARRALVPEAARIVALLAPTEHLAAIRQDAVEVGIVHRDAQMMVRATRAAAELANGLSRFAQASASQPATATITSAD
jgi:hypothetical protein